MARSPSSIALPRFALSDDKPVVVQTIYVRKIKEGGLKINKASSSLPFVTLDVATQTDGFVYAVAVKFDKSKLTGPGDYKGTIRIETNDAEVPVIEIPIQGKAD